MTVFVNTVIMSIEIEEGEMWVVPDWIDSIVTLLVTRDAPDPRDHESILGILARPSWVQNLEQTYLSSWASYPETRKDATASTFGLKIGKDLGGAFAGFEKLKDDPETLERVIQKSLSFFDEGLPDGEGMIGSEIVDLLREQSDQLIEAHRELVAQIFRIVFRQKFQDIADFVSGFGRGLSSWLKEESFEEPENERVLMARVLLDRWERAEAASTLQDVSDMVLEGMNPQKRSFVAENPAALKAFEENFRKLCSRIDLKKGGPGRPSKK